MCSTQAICRQGQSDAIRPASGTLLQGTSGGCQDMTTLLQLMLDARAHHEPAQECCSALTNLRVAFARTRRPQLILL